MKYNFITAGLILTFLLICARGIGAQSRPGSEHERLAAFVGDWTFEQETRDGPSGIWRKSVQKWPGRWIPGGFFVAARFSSADSETQEVSGLEILGFDPLQKKYVGFVYNGNGTRMNFTATFIGHIWAQEASSIAVDGTETQQRSTWTLSSDFSSLTAEILTLTEGEWWISGRVKGSKAKD